MTAKAAPVIKYRRVRKRILFLFLFVLLPILLYPVFISSFAFRCIYLPYIGKLARVELTADDVRFSLFRPDRHLQIYNLRFVDPNAADFMIDYVSCSVDADLLLHGKMKFSDIHVEGARMIRKNFEPIALISDLVLDTDRYRIGNILIHNFLIDWTIDDSKIKCVFKDLRASGMTSLYDNLATGNLYVSADTPAFKIERIPAVLNMKFGINQEFEPQFVSLVCKTGALEENTFSKLAGIDLTLKELKSQLQFSAIFNQNNVRYQWSSESSADQFQLSGSAPLLKPKLSIRGAGAFDTDQQTFQSDKFHIRLTEDKKELLEFDSSGPVKFSCKNGAYQFLPNHARARISSKKMSLKPFISLLPFSGGDPVLDLDYRIQVDPAKKCLDGTLDASLSGLSVFSASGNDSSGTITVHAGLRSSGIKNVKEYLVSGGKADFRIADKVYASAELNGQFRFADTYLDLTGTISQQYGQFAALMKADSLEEYLKNLSQVRDKSVNHYDTKLHSDAGENKLVWNIRGKAGNRLQLPNDSRKHSFHFSMDGDFNWMPGRQRLSVKPLQFGSKDLFEVNCQLSMIFPSKQFMATLNIPYFSPDLMYQLAEYMEPRTKNMINKSGIPKGKFSCTTDISGDSLFSKIKVSKPVLIFSNAETNSEVRMEFNDKIEIKPAEQQYSVLTPRILLINVPLTWSHFLFSDDSGFEFKKGFINGCLDTAIRQNQDGFQVNANLFFREPAFRASSTVYDIGACHISGPVSVNKSAMSISLFNLNLINRPPGEKPVVNKVSLFWKFDKPYNGHIDLSMPCLRTYLLKSLYPPINDYLEIEKASGSGTLVFDYPGEDKVSDLRIKVRADSLHLYSNNPEDFRFPELNVDYSFRYRTGKNQPSEYHTVFSFNNQNGKSYLHSDYCLTAQNGKPDISVLKSGSVDIPFIRKVIQFNTRAKQTTENTIVSQKPQKRKQICDEKIFLALNNIRVDDHISLNISGTAETKNNITSANRLSVSGGLNGTLSFQANRSYSNLLPYQGELRLENVDFQNLAASLWSTKRTDDISGTIRLLQCQVSGTGFTKNDMLNDMELDFLADCTNLSVPLALTRRSILLKIALLPIFYFPRLVENIPDQIARTFLLETLAAHVDILTGNKNLEFKRGKVKFNIRKGIMNLEDLRLTGPYIDTEIQNGKVELSNMELDVNSDTKFAELLWPIHFYGKMDDPSVNYSKFALLFPVKNTFALLQGTARILSLGLIPKFNQFSDLSEKMMIPEMPSPDPVTLPDETRPQK